MRTPLRDDAARLILHRMNYARAEVCEGGEAGLDPSSECGEAELHWLVMRCENESFDLDRQFQIIEVGTQRVVCKIKDGETEWLEPNIPRRLGWQRSPNPY